MAIKEMLKRISVLSSEIDANEDENKVMRDEIVKLYLKIEELRVIPLSSSITHSIKWY